MNHTVEFIRKQEVTSIIYSSPDREWIIVVMENICHWKAEWDNIDPGVVYTVYASGVPATFLPRQDELVEKINFNLYPALNEEGCKNIFPVAGFLEYVFPVVKQDSYLFDYLADILSELINTKLDG